MKNNYNSRKRRAGFTIVELVVTIAIIAILCAVAIPGFMALSKSLRMAKLDASAKTIFTAAQNRMSELRSSGELSELEGYSLSAKPEDFPDDVLNFEDFKPDFYQISSDNSSITTLLPAGSIESSLIEEGTFYIEYNKKAGVVYGVFFSDEYFDYNDVYNKEGIRREKSVRKSNKPMMGYYGGAAVDWEEHLKNFLPAPTFEVINTETLSVKFTAKANHDYTLVIRDEYKNEWQYKTNDIKPFNVAYDPLNSMYTITLDSLKNNYHFSQIFNDLVPGSNFLVPGSNLTVSLSYSNEESFSSIGKKHTNSLFALKEGTQVQISYCRQLQNLDCVSSGLSASASLLPDGKLLVTKAVQTNSIDWSTALVDSGTKFQPITNLALISYNGNGNEVKNFNNSLFGEFGILGGETVSELQNLVLLDPAISISTNGSKAIGALANYVYNGNVSNCILRATEKIGSNATLSVTTSSVTYTGGLIGYGDKLTLKKSSASLIMINSHSTYTGGLVGGMTNSTVSACYADTGWYYIERKAWASNTGIIATGSDVGGLFGFAQNSDVSNCYSAGNISNSGAATKKVGGLAGDSLNTKYSACYAAATYIGLAEAMQAYGIIGNDNDMAGQTNCYFLQSARTLANQTQQKNSTGLAGIFTASAFTAAWGRPSAATTSVYGQSGTYLYPRLKGTIHYGDWPIASSYTVVYWLEKPNLPINFDKTSAANYDNVYSEIRSGFGGESVGSVEGGLANQAKIALLQVDAAGAAVTGAPFAGYDRGATGTISGDETTVINVYYTRNVYTMVYVLTFPVTNGSIFISDQIKNRMTNPANGDLAPNVQNATGVVEAFKDQKLVYNQAIKYTIKAKLGQSLESVFPLIFMEGDNGSYTRSFTHYNSSNKETHVLRGWGPYSMSNITVVSTSHFTAGNKWATSYDAPTRTATYNASWATVGNSTLTRGYWFMESLNQTDPGDSVPVVSSDPERIYSVEGQLDTKRLEVKELTYEFGAVIKIPEDAQKFDLTIMSLPYWANTGDRQLSVLMEGFTYYYDSAAKRELNCYQWNPGQYFYQLKTAGGNLNYSQRYYFFARNSYTLNIFLGAGKTISLSEKVKYQMPLKTYETELYALVADALPGSIFDGFYYDADFTNPVTFGSADIMPALDLTIFPKYKEIFLPTGVVYYEKYTDGTYGFEGDPGDDRENAYPIKDTSLIESDGYVYISKTAIAELVAFEKDKIGNYYIYNVPDPETISGSYYQKVIVLGVTYYFNPDFARVVLKSGSAPLNPAEPISIRTGRHLSNLSANQDYWSRSFKQEINIYLDSQALSPIGSDPADAFSGTYNGGCNIISAAGFTMSAGNDYAGLFGYNTGKLEDIVFVNDGDTDIEITGNICTGALAGYNGSTGEIINCAVSGFNISGGESGNAGGLVGENAGTIRNSSASNYNGDDDTGEIISGGMISGGASSIIGGFVGVNKGNIYGCYAIAMLQYSGSTAGGFVGNADTGMIENCYCVSQNSSGYMDNFAGLGTGYDSGTCKTVDSTTEVDKFNEDYQNRGFSDVTAEDTFPTLPFAAYLEPFPYTSSVVNKSGHYVHYGKWPI